MLSVQSKSLIAQAAIISPRYRNRYYKLLREPVSVSGRAVNTAMVKQNNLSVESVRPGTSVELFCNDLFHKIIGGTQFMVINIDTGETVLDRPAVAVSIMGNAYINWNAPTVTGSYVFYGDASNRESTAAYFSVSGSAPEPYNQGKTNWWLIGGAVIGATALVAVLIKKI